MAFRILLAFVFLVGFQAQATSNWSDLSNKIHDIIETGYTDHWDYLYFSTESYDFSEGYPSHCDNDTQTQESLNHSEFMSKELPQIMESLEAISLTQEDNAIERGHKKLVLKQVKAYLTRASKEARSIETVSVSGSCYSAHWGMWEWSLRGDQESIHIVMGGGE